MSKLADASESVASTTGAEMRLRKAMELAAAKKKGDTHQRRLKEGEYNQQNTDPAFTSALSSTEMRLREAMEIAALKSDFGKSLETDKAAKDPESPASAQPTSKNIRQKNIVKKAPLRPKHKTKTVNPGWLAKQVNKLLGNLTVTSAAGKAKQSK